jgi:hypothetical protein
MQVAEHPGESTEPEPRHMIFQESDVGDHRIYVGAIEAPRGDGYIAALVVEHRPFDSGRAPRETYRDDALACGHQWPAAEIALVYAMRRGREVVARERQRLFLIDAAAEASA